MMERLLWIQQSTNNQRSDEALKFIGSKKIYSFISGSIHSFTFFFYFYDMFLYRLQSSYSSGYSFIFLAVSCRMRHMTKVFTVELHVDMWPEGPSGGPSKFSKLTNCLQGDGWYGRTCRLNSPEIYLLIQNWIPWQMTASKIRIKTFVSFLSRHSLYALISFHQHALYFQNGKNLCLQKNMIVFSYLDTN